MLGKFLPFLALAGAVAIASILAASSLHAQSTGSVEGRVIGADGGEPLADLTVRLENALSGFSRQTVTDADGVYRFRNVPFQTYSLSISGPGFSALRESIAVDSSVPVTGTHRLIASPSEALTVTAFEGFRLVEPDETGTRHELSLNRIEKLPTAVGERGIESILMSFPGFAANANGSIHPRGAHNQMTFVVDGMPISDQLTGSFASALDASIVDTIELYTGNIPAEFGNKVSGVAHIVTRSGMGSRRKFGGSAQIGAAEFDTLSNVAQFFGETSRVGYFVSIRSMKSNRFLDQVSLDNLHNGGNAQRFSSRFDYEAPGGDRLRLNLMTGRSSFQVANLRSQHTAGQRQRQLLRDASASVGWFKTLSPLSTLDVTASYRTSIAQLFPSAGDTPVEAAQARHLTTVNLGTRYSRIAGAHNLRMGVDLQRFPLSENFSFGITDPSFNDPESEFFNPNLAPQDLTRGGAPFHFSDWRSGRLFSLFAHDQISWRRLAFSLGLRYDDYRLLSEGRQLQPRVGLAYHLPFSRTVLRASYNRTYQTPPNENLLLAGSAEAARLAPPVVTESLGSAVFEILPERQNVYEGGVQQALGDSMSVHLTYYHKNSVDLQDNDNFLDTGIIFPTSLAKSRVNGFEARLEAMPSPRINGTLSLTHARAIVTPPFTGGLLLGREAVDALSEGPFIIDHDQALALHGVLHYRVRDGVWTTWSMRHDSGLVSNPSDPAEVAADPDFFDLLPYVDLTSDPPRARPRNVVDFNVGFERSIDDLRRWDLQLQVTNLFDATALYNFQSIFVGTRVVQPRTLGLKLRWHW